MYLVQTREGEALDRVTIRARNIRTVSEAKALQRAYRAKGFTIVQIDKQEGAE